MATSVQRQQTLTHVLNCQNNLSTTASFFYGDFRAMKSLTFNLYGTFMINRSNHIIYTATVSNNHYLRMILIANVSNLSCFISLTF